MFLKLDDDVEQRRAEEALARVGEDAKTKLQTRNVRGKSGVIETRPADRAAPGSRRVWHSVGDGPLSWGYRGTSLRRNRDFDIGCVFLKKKRNFPKTG